MDAFYPRSAGVKSGHALLVISSPRTDKETRLLPFKAQSLMPRGYIDTRARALGAWALLPLTPNRAS